ncbi:hypothetical protein CCZ01_09145 [Helicobacter monodelphidis]|uniref:hypothetical protein n=1 Tax=Helicobacter sp. 15-1451 TaxID=2004995 RepID=UPI000DCB8473|nr:hypothetical protein [Helicobacter sp. 15-1451]RAX56562.1 hypothetical protein CCZ01_09145 [Helicobacter sp. 15-1451]
MADFVVFAKKQLEHKEIREAINDLYKAGYESNRNAEFYANLKQAEEQCLKQNLKGEALQAYLAPFYNALSDSALESSFGKEEREQNKQIWENKELQAKRVAYRGQLNREFADFRKFARQNGANDHFMEQVKYAQKECYRLACDLPHIKEAIAELSKMLQYPEFQMTANQKEISLKFDNLIQNIRQQGESEQAKLSPDFWQDIFTAKQQLQSEEAKAELVDSTIQHIQNYADKIFANRAFRQEVTAQKAIIQEQSKQEYINSLTDPQKETRIKFLNFIETFKGKHNKAFWDEIVAPAKKEAIENALQGKDLQSLFERIQQESFNPKYQTQEQSSTDLRHDNSALNEFRYNYRQKS